MSLIGEQVLMRVYLQNADRAPHTPTHERIVAAARKHGLAGATVIRGILGTGYHGIIKASRWSLVEHVPVIVEIVDSAQRLAEFIKGPLDEIMIGGMMTLERAVVMMYRRGNRGTAAVTPVPARCSACGASEIPPDAVFCPNCGRGFAAGSTTNRKVMNSPEPSALKIPPQVQPLSTLPQIQPGAHMTVNENGVLLRVFIGESDEFEGKPLHEAIIQKVRDLGLAGATVLRGSEGFGARSVVHKSSLLEMSTDLPIVIEIADTNEKIQLLLPHLEKMVQEGMITMEYVVILLYRHGREAAPDPAPPPG